MKTIFFFGHRWKISVILSLALARLPAWGQPANDNFTNRFQLLCQPTTISPNADVTFAIAAGDMNNDGRADVVVGNLGGRIRLYLNNGTLSPFAGVATLNISADTSNTWALAIGDVNNDGWRDVIAGNMNGQRSRIYTNNRTANPFNGVAGRDLTTSPYSTFAVALADVNGDTNLDLIMGNGSGGTAKSLLLLNNGSADPFSGVTPLIINTNSQDTRAVAVADVNGDNRPDVILGNFNDRVRLYTNNGTANPYTNVASTDISTDTGPNRALVVGDVNGDGKRDVIVGRNGQTIRLYLNNGTGNPFNGVTGSDISSDTNATTSLALGDVNGDGKPDLIAGNENQRNRVYLNNGTINPFNGVTGLDVSLDALPTLAVALADFNGDGKLDLLDGNTTKTNRVYLNYGGTNPFGIVGTSVPGNNFGATKETGEPNHAGNAGGKSVWWMWQAPSTGTFRLDTVGSDFDTTLSVYTGNAVNGLSLVSSNDNSGGGGTSLINFSATLGTTYHIAVDGYNGASGNIKLNLGQPLVITCPPNTSSEGFFDLPGPQPNSVGYTNACGPVSVQLLSQTFTPNGCATIATRTYQVTDSCGRSAQCNQTITIYAPINDYFTNRINLDGSSISTSACTYYATKEYASNEPDHHFNSGGKSVWWSWTPPYSGRFAIDTSGSSFNTVLAIYTGTSVSNLDRVTSDDDSGTGTASKVIEDLSSLTEYQIAVDGYYGDSGTAILQIYPCDPPVISGFNSWTEPVPGGIALNVCATVSGANTYKWTLDSTTVTTTSACHTFLLSATDEGNHNVSLIANNDCGFDGEPYTPPATCAICLSRGTPTLLVGTSGSGSGITNTSGCGNLTTNARWFKLVVTNYADTGWLTLSTERMTNNGTLAVYTGSITSPNSMTRIGCDTNSLTHPARVTFNADYNTVYWVAVDPRTNNAPTLQLASGFEPAISTFRFGSSRTFEVFSTLAPPISYTLEMTTNLATWTKVQTTNASTGYPYLHFRDPTATNSARRFYRMKSTAQ